MTLWTTTIARRIVRLEAASATASLCAMQTHSPWVRKCHAMSNNKIGTLRYKKVFKGVPKELFSEYISKKLLKLINSSWVL